MLIGKEGDEKISVEELGELAGTINYEIVSRIGSHIPRIIV
jgi:alanine racemase